MKDSPYLASVRQRSRSARERSRNLRVTSQQLRESLENLRAYAAEVSEGRIESPHPPQERPEYSDAWQRTPLDIAALIRQRVYRARAEAKNLRRQAADLRQQAAEFRARSENLRGSYSLL